MDVRDPMESGHTSRGSSLAAHTVIAASLACAFALGMVALIREPAPDPSLPSAERSPHVWSLSAESAHVSGGREARSGLDTDPRSEPFRRERSISPRLTSGLAQIADNPVQLPRRLD